MKSIFQLSWTQVTRDNDWILPLFFMLLCSLFGDHLAPVNDDPTMAPSTRTQSLWMCAWLASLLWVGFVTARSGLMQRRYKLRGFWKSLGVGDRRYFAAIFGVPVLLNVCLFGMAALLSILFGHTAGTNFDEWIVVNLQSVIFAVITQSLIAAVILGLTNWVDSSPAFVCGFLLNLYGLYGIQAVDHFRSGASQELAVVADLLWTVGPHLHFGDFMSRLTFGWGPLPVTPMINASLYLIGFLLLMIAVSMKLWGYRRGS